MNHFSMLAKECDRLSFDGVFASSLYIFRPWFVICRNHWGNYSYQKDRNRNSHTWFPLEYIQTFFGIRYNSVSLFIAAFAIFNSSDNVIDRFSSILNRNDVNNQIKLGHAFWNTTSKAETAWENRLPGPERFNWLIGIFDAVAFIGHLNGAQGGTEIPGN